MNKIDDAIHYYSSTLQLDPNHANAAFARGACYNKKHEFEEAINQYE